MDGWLKLATKESMPSVQVSNVYTYYSDINTPSFLIMKALNFLKMNSPPNKTVNKTDMYNVKAEIDSSASREFISNPNQGRIKSNAIVTK